jgi:hypothetical protein
MGMSFTKYGLRGLLALAMLLEAGLFSAGCSKPVARVEAKPKTVQKEHAVRLRVETKDGKPKAMSHPETLVIPGYARDGKGHTVTWTFRHTSTVITFADKDMPTPTCVLYGDLCGGECTLEIPAGLLSKDPTDPTYESRPFKYTVTGKQGTTDLDANDPSVEIER